MIGERFYKPARKYVVGGYNDYNIGGHSNHSNNTSMGEIKNQRVYGGGSTGSRNHLKNKRSNDEDIISTLGDYEGTTYDRDVIQPADPYLLNSKKFHYHSRNTTKHSSGASQSWKFTGDDGSLSMTKVLRTTEKNDNTKEELQQTSIVLGGVTTNLDSTSITGNDINSGPRYASNSGTTSLVVGSSTLTDRYIKKSKSDSKLFPASFLSATRLTKQEAADARCIVAIEQPAINLKKIEADYKLKTNHWRPITERMGTYHALANSLEAFDHDTKRATEAAHACRLLGTRKTMISPSQVSNVEVTMVQRLHIELKQTILEVHLRGMKHRNKSKARPKLMRLMNELMGTGDLGWPENLPLRIESECLIALCHIDDMIDKYRRILQDRKVSILEFIEREKQRKLSLNAAQANKETTEYKMRHASFVIEEGEDLPEVAKNTEDNKDKNPLVENKEDSNNKRLLLDGKEEESEEEEDFISRKDRIRKRKKRGRNIFGGTGNDFYVQVMTEIEKKLPQLDLIAFEPMEEDIDFLVDVLELAWKYKKTNLSPEISMRCFELARIWVNYMNDEKDANIEALSNALEDPTEVIMGRFDYDGLYMEDTREILEDHLADESDFSHQTQLWLQQKGYDVLCVKLLREHCLHRTFAPNLCAHSTTILGIINLDALMMLLWEHIGGEADEGNEYCELYLEKKRKISLGKIRKYRNLWYHAIKVLTHATFAIATADEVKQLKGLELIQEVLKVLHKSSPLDYVLGKSVSNPSSNIPNPFDRVAIGLNTDDITDPNYRNIEQTCSLNPGLNEIDKVLAIELDILKNNLNRKTSKLFHNSRGGQYRNNVKFLTSYNVLEDQSNPYHCQGAVGSILTQDELRRLDFWSTDSSQSLSQQDLVSGQKKKVFGKGGGKGGGKSEGKSGSSNNLGSNFADVTKKIEKLDIEILKQIWEERIPEKKKILVKEMNAEQKIIVKYGRPYKIPNTEVIHPYTGRVNLDTQAKIEKLKEDLVFAILVCCDIVSDEDMKKREKKLLK